MKTVDRICPICGIAYKANPTRLKYGRETTCSKICSYKLRANKRFSKVSVTCGYCGKEFFRSPCQIKSKHKLVFCSAACQYASRRAGITPRIVTNRYVIVNHISAERRKLIAQSIWQKRRKNGTDRHTEATKRKLSEITATNIATGKINRISKIEYVVADILDFFEVNFIHQYLIRDTITGRFCACVDFFIPEKNAVIEVNGTFWHADPRFYDRENLKPAQIRTLSKYTAKINILNSFSITCFEIWEHDIKTDIKSVKDFIFNTFVT